MVPPHGLCKVRGWSCQHLTGQLLVSKTVEQACGRKGQVGLLLFSSGRKNMPPLPLAVIGAAGGRHRGPWKACWPPTDPRKASFYHDLVTASQAFFRSLWFSVAFGTGSSHSQQQSWGHFAHHNSSSPLCLPRQVLYKVPSPGPSCGISKALFQLSV